MKCSLINFYLKSFKVELMLDFHDIKTRSNNMSHIKGANTRTEIKIRSSKSQPKLKSDEFEKRHH